MQIDAELTRLGNGHLACYQGMRRDAKEFDLKYRKQFDDADKYASELIQERNIKGLGSCHSFWQFKKEYLKKLGIKWRSPAELNPEIMFD